MQGLSAFFGKLFSAFNFKSTVSKFISGISKWFNDIIKKIMDFVKSALQKPKSKEDYVLWGTKYISKKLILLGGALLILGGYFLIAYAYPWADGRVWRASIEYGNEKYKTFSGKVRIFYNNKTIFIGDMSEGKLSGKGKQYDENKRLVYEGDFEEDMYSGEGVLYQNDVAVYKGNFSNNLFEGLGEQYNLDGKLIYKGNFSLGQRSGEGVEYDPATGKKIYSGNFSADLREGDGTEFKNDGVSKIYKGSFAAGAYEGQGCLYEDGKIKYKGDFALGVYEGNGSLFDTVTENVIYEGAFVGGKYEGDGKLYDAGTGKLVYKGSFVAGRTEGTGECYDKLGAIIYSGNFSEGSIAYLNYIGKSFDDVSKEFGRESFKAKVKESLVVTYLNKNMSMIFNNNSQEDVDSIGSYTCDKIIINLKNTTFKGLSLRSSQAQVTGLLGDPYSSINYAVPKPMESAFKALSIDIKSSSMTPCEKFIMENYMVRLFYNQSKEIILAAEVSSI